jgi:hypothetical protein
MRVTFERSTSERQRQASTQQAAQRASAQQTGAMRPASAALQRLTAFANQSAGARATARYASMLNPGARARDAAPAARVAATPVQRRALTHVGAADFALDPGGRTLLEWQQLGDHLAADADVATFARIPNWEIASVTHLAAAFAANANGHSAAEWATLATHAGVNAVGTVVRFARLAGWQFASVDALVTAFTANAGNRTVANWVTLANVAVDAHAAVAAFARIPNWTVASLGSLVQAFDHDAGGRSADDWVLVAASTGNNQHADASTLARIPNWSGARVAALATSYRNNAVNGLNAAALAALAATIPNSAAAPAAAVTLSAIPNVANHLQLIGQLYQREGATAAAIQAIITHNLNPVFNANERRTLIDTHLAGLSVPQVSDRLTLHGLPVGVNAAAVMGTMTNDMTQLNQSLAARHGMSDARKDDVRKAFRIRNWSWNDLRGYLTNNAVRNALDAANLNQNSARWLYLFANEHRGPLAVADNVRQAVVTPHGTINVRGWIVNHVCNRHTFRHFDFTNIAAQNTMFAAGQDENTVANNVAQIAGNPTVDAHFGQWAAGGEFQVGSYQVRVAPDPASFGNYRFTQFFLRVAAGIPIAQAPLAAMHNNNLF